MSTEIKKRSDSQPIQPKKYKKKPAALSKGFVYEISHWPVVATFEKEIMTPQEYIAEFARIHHKVLYYPDALYYCFVGKYNLPLSEEDKQQTWANTHSSSEHEFYCFNQLLIEIDTIAKYTNNQRGSSEVKGFAIFHINKKENLCELIAYLPLENAMPVKLLLPIIRQQGNDLTGNLAERISRDSNPPSSFKLQEEAIKEFHHLAPHLREALANFIDHPSKLPQVKNAFQCYAASGYAEVSGAWNRALYLAHHYPPPESLKILINQLKEQALLLQSLIKSSFTSTALAQVQDPLQLFRKINRFTIRNLTQLAQECIKQTDSKYSYALTTIPYLSNTIKLLNSINSIQDTELEQGIKAALLAGPLPTSLHPIVLDYVGDSFPSEKKFTISPPSKIAASTNFFNTKETQFNINVSALLSVVNDLLSACYNQLLTADQSKSILEFREDIIYLLKLTELLQNPEGLRIQEKKTDAKKRTDPSKNTKENLLQLLQQADGAYVERLMHRLNLQLEEDPFRQRFKNNMTWVCDKVFTAELVPVSSDAAQHLCMKLVENDKGDKILDKKNTGSPEKLAQSLKWSQPSIEPTLILFKASADGGYEIYLDAKNKEKLKDALSEINDQYYVNFREQVKNLSLQVDRYHGPNKEQIDELLTSFLHTNLKEQTKRNELTAKIEKLKANPEIPSILSHFEKAIEQITGQSPQSTNTLHMIA